MANGWAGIAQSVQRLATCWTVLGLNCDGGEVFCTRLDGPWAYTQSPHDEYQVFSGGKTVRA
jgi:hypothetical protein